ncbi:MAG: tyrosine-protein phosphatase [Paludibacteraceae bacterium]|nr:tyrosine-protein phosphatase [Paludibacteraceae bacterium]
MNIIFDNILNARDLGGIPAAGGRTIRPYRLLRTAHLHDASDADLQRLQDEYRICRVFDFRSLGETEFQPDRPVPGAEHHLLPTIDMRAEQQTGKPIPEEAFRELDRHIVNYSFYPEVQQMAANMYPSLIRSEFSQLQYASFLRLIVEAPDDGGILWHCAQGKDRTGWGAAFLMFALGVDRETIISDFRLSNVAYQPLVDRLNADIDRRGGGEAEKAVILAFMGVSTPNFIRTLDLIDREYGGMTAYLHDILCLTHDDIQILRKRYLINQ